MICPTCQAESDRVLETKSGKDKQGQYVRRRRRCPNKHRFTTVERVRATRAELLAAMTERLSR